VLIEQCLLSAKYPWSADDHLPNIIDAKVSQFIACTIDGIGLRSNQPETKICHSRIQMDTFDGGVVDGLRQGCSSEVDGSATSIGCPFEEGGWSSDDRMKGAVLELTF
jgi:hypothetical protein